MLAETFDVQPWACDELAQNNTRLLALDADMYAFNYYGHDNFDPEAVMQQVWAAMTLVKGYLSRRCDTGENIDTCSPIASCYPEPPG